MQSHGSPSVRKFTKPSQGFRACLLLCLLLLFTMNTSVAFSDHNAEKLDEYLIQEKINLTTANNNAILSSKSPEIIDQTALTLRKKQNAAMQALTYAKIISLNDFLSSLQKQQQNLAIRLKKLQQLPLEKLQNTPAVDEHMDHINALKSENIKTIQLINDNITSVKAFQSTLLAEQHRLDLLQANMTEQEQLDQLREKIHTLKQARDALYQKNVDLQQGIKKEATFTETLNYETQLLLNNQAAILFQHQIIELRLQKKLIAADFLFLKNQDVKTSELVTDLYATAVSQLSGIEQSLKKMQGLLVNEKSILSDNHLKQQVSILQKSVALRLKQVIVHKAFLQKERGMKQAQLNKKLGSRKSLAEYHLNSWPLITGQLMQVPLQLYHYTQLLVFKARDNYLQQASWWMPLVWGIPCLIVLVAVALRRVLHRLVQGKERSSMSGHLYDGALILLYRNIYQLAAATLLMSIFFLEQLVFANYRLLIDLFLVWFAFRNLILVARLLLLERISDSSGKDVKLYYRLKWLLLAGGWSTALMVLGHQLPLSLLLQDIFNRLFMLFLLALSLVVWKSRDVIPYLLHPLFKSKKRYVRKTISLLIVLVSVTLLTTSIIGLIGYIDLAWTTSGKQAYLLLVMTSYLLLRGLILDALHAMSKWMISSLHNGWLCVEVILKPLDAIARLALVLLAVVILFQSFGWNADSHVVAVLMQIGHYRVVNLSGAHITVFSALEFIALLFVFIWFAKWTREFCFRWVYRRVADSGVRNSLAVFTQYAVIILGALLTLRVLGIDFTGMAIVFGGLAVGMGFGLRDFASNIVGGVMLLIERPVREGDLITLGEYEGRVAHIGIRSMRVSSWDNMEVLIPNAETFNKPFTNWTHQDNIVRTVVPIKVNRGDEPTEVQQLILDVLVIIPEVLSKPPPQVLLTKIDEVLIEFEIRYFINVQLYTRVEIRSKVLFAIMAQFKAAGVMAPIPSLNVELNHDGIPYTSACE